MVGDPALCQVVMQTFLPVINLEAYTILALNLIDWAFVSITEAITALRLNSGSGQRLSHCPLCLIDVLFESISWLHQAFFIILRDCVPAMSFVQREYAKMPSQLAGSRLDFAPSKRHTGPVCERCCIPSHQVRSTSKTRTVTHRRRLNSSKRPLR